ncbi:hypothetical protein B0H19DRAFT_1155124 [Mycena capillaripes]|nr:hypothetical protein B0H19DRAFT_1155124 [Mycena capillaripes]
MLVARRVKEWVEPLLYWVLTVMPASTGSDSLVPICRLEILLRLLSSKPPSFFHFNVETLYIGGIFSPQSEVFVPPILAACTGVTSLVVAISVLPHLSALNALQSLSRLSIDLKGLYEHYPLDFPQPMFRNLMHLEITGFLWTRQATHIPALCTGLTLIPHLTHLAFRQITWIDALHLQLRNAPLQRLMCIIFLCSSDGEKKSSWPSSADQRFVTIGQENFWIDWQRGILAGKDYWTLAEAFIAAKRAREIRTPCGRTPDSMSAGWWIR